MKIALGADHGGYLLKGQIKDLVTAAGHRTVDFGTDSSEPCDYPNFAYRVAKAVSEKKADRGILICKSGNGMAIVANKLPDVRAAICFDTDVAKLSRQHNDANVLVLGSEHLLDEPENIVRSWLSSGFEGGRHERRVKQVLQIEKKIFHGPGRKGRKAEGGRRKGKRKR